MSFAQEKFFGHSYVDNIPRKNLVLRALSVCIKIGIDPRILKDRYPFVITEIFLPAVKSHSAPVRFHNRLSESPVSSCKHGFYAAD